MSRHALYALWLLATAVMLAAAGGAGAGTGQGVDSHGAQPLPDTLQTPSPSPAAWQSTVQMNAPSINSASPDLVDRAAFPARGGVAWDERLEKGPNDRAITINVTPLAFAGAGGRHEGRTAEGAELTELIRHITARVTFGGPLQSIGRSNATRAGRPMNHVTSELKLILLDDGSTNAGSGHFAVLALALAADNVASSYGLDRYGATLIAEREGPCVWTANAGYRVVERYHSPERIEETKLATGARWRVLEVAEHPVELDLSGGCLLRNHGRTDWQDAARVDVPITSGLSLSAAVRLSHRPELPGQDTRREVLGLAYGL